MEEDFTRVVRRRFERIYNMMECKSYIKNDEIPENKEIFVYAFKYFKTDKVDKYMVIGCELDELYENDKLFNFWSNKFTNKEIELRSFKITGWSFMTLVKRNKVFQIQSIVCSRIVYLLYFTKVIYMSL